MHCTLNYQTLRSRHYNEFFTMLSASLSVSEHETMSQEPPIELYWLPVHHRIMYKLCTFMHGVVYGHALQYLSDMMVRVSQLTGRSHLRAQRTRVLTTRREYV